jgi:hypothetical protein
LVKFKTNIVIKNNTKPHRIAMVKVFFEDRNRFFIIIFQLI